MNDLISRQAAIDVAKEELDNGTFYDIPSKIEYLPSAQPEIITCENCKYADGKKIADGRRWCSLHGVYMKYCSDAEVRTNEEVDIS